MVNRETSMTGVQETSMTGVHHKNKFFGKKINASRQGGNRRKYDFPQKLITYTQAETVKICIFKEK